MGGGVATGGGIVTGGGVAMAGGGHQYLQAGSPWPHAAVHQQQLSQQQQQLHHMMHLQPHRVAPPTAGGLRSVPPLPGPAVMYPPLRPHAALWAPSASQPHLEAHVDPQQCWYCLSSAPYWRHL